jgi:Ran GTPase-activating protein (RanGAP) involved in mRNA processing and transport
MSVCTCVCVYVYIYRSHDALTQLMTAGILPAGATALSTSLTKNQSLVSLELSYNALEDQGTQSIAQALDQCAIKTLGLTSNGLTDVGAAHLAEALERDNCALTSLSISNNNISDIGATRLAEALSVNVRLETLYVEENAIGPAGMDVLARAVRDTFTVADIPEDVKLAAMMGLHERLGHDSHLYRKYALCYFFSIANLMIMFAYVT